MGSLLFSCISCATRPKSVLSDIPEDLLEDLTKTRVVNVYKKGQTIFYEGNQPFGIYCLNGGKVKLFKHAPEGKSFIVRIAKPGDLLGYRSFFTNESYSATAEVLEDATICFLDKEKFFDLLRKYPSLSLKLLEMMGQDLKCAEDHSRDLAFRSANERIAELFLTLCETFGIGQEDQTIKLDIQLSRQDLANMLGTTTETAVRLLTWLKEKNIIKTKNKNIYITDPKLLSEIIPEY